MRQQGTGANQYRFVVCVQHDGHEIYKGYSSMAAAAAYAKEYTGATLKFTPDDREAGRGRDMGKPTVLYRVQPDGSRVAWQTYMLKDEEVVTKDTPEYKAEQKAQAERNAAAVERAAAEVANTYRTEDSDNAKMAKAIGDALGDKLGEFIAALQEQSDAKKPAAATAATK